MKLFLVICAAFAVIAALAVALMWLVAWAVDGYARMAEGDVFCEIAAIRRGRRNILVAAVIVTLLVIAVSV